MAQRKIQVKWAEVLVKTATFKVADDFNIQEESAIFDLIDQLPIAYAEDHLDDEYVESWKISQVEEVKES